MIEGMVYVGGGGSRSVVTSLGPSIVGRHGRLSII